LKRLLVKLPTLKEVRHMLDDREKDPSNDEAIDPPETGGGTEKAIRVDSVADQKSAVDPPETGGGN
jgi:hypothetical protein